MGDLEDNLESLFLLEVLVDNVLFDKPPKEDNLRETCVGFQFLKYPPLIICEEDFVYMADDEFEKQNIQFKSGKSILFALPSLQEDNPNLGSVHVWVTRRIDRTDKTKVMGSTNINLSGSFENLLQASAKQLQTSPLSKFIRDVYPFHAEDGKQAGTISAFLRVSCFGKLIVTQFEVKGKEKFNFRGMEDKANAQGGGVRFGPGTKEGGREIIQGQGGPETDPGQGMYPGMGPGMGSGMYPGMGSGMYPGMGPGMFGPGMGMYPGMGQGMYGQGQFGGPGMSAQVRGPCPGPKPWLHGKKGVLPCGEPVCPAGNCGHFPCSHAASCNSPPCAQMMGPTCNMGACQQPPTCVPMCPGTGVGMPPGMGMATGMGMAAGMGMAPGMGMGMAPGMGMGGATPVNMNVQVTEEDITATMKTGTSNSDSKQAAKGKGKGKKK